MNRSPTSSYGASREQKRNAVEEESQLVQEFLHLMRSRLSVKALQQGEAFLRQKNSIDVKGLSTGVLAGMCTFAALRKGPIFLTRYWVHRKGLNHSVKPHAEKPLEDVTRCRKSPFAQQRLSASFPVGNVNYRSGMYFGWLLVDVTLSASLAAVVARISSSSSPQSDLLGTFATLPLQDGTTGGTSTGKDLHSRSDFVRELCPLATAYVQNHQRTVASDPSCHRNKPITPQWKAVVEFATSCLSRGPAQQQLQLRSGEVEKAWRDDGRGYDGAVATNRRRTIQWNDS